MRLSLAIHGYFSRRTRIAAVGGGAQATSSREVVQREHYRLATGVRPCEYLFRLGGRIGRSKLVRCEKFSWSGLGRRTQGAVAMASDIDVHVGRRLRRRRRLLGLTQLKLGEAVGMRFQQIQKYECGANRVTAERLYRLAVALGVPTTYFFEGLPGAPGTAPAGAIEDPDLIANDVLLGRKETMELIRAYYMLSERPRRRLLDLAKVLRAEAVTAA